MLLYESPFVIVRYRDDIQAIEWSPAGIVPLRDWKESFIAGSNFMLENYEKFNQINWLNDTRLLEAAGGEQVQWLDSAINDRMIASRIASNVAFVEPESPTGNIAVDLYISFTNARPDNISTIKKFEAIELAEDWLKSKILVKSF